MSTRAAVPDAVTLRMIDEPWARAEAFARRFTEPHVRLALHAAVPTGFSPELLHLIRINFVPDAPFIAEADLLLSPLCRDTGAGLYEMDPPIREILYGELAADPQFGPGRIASVAEFLLAWALRELPRSRTDDTRAWLRTLQWTGLAHVAPDLVARELALALGQSMNVRDDGETLRLVRFTDAMAGALAGQIALVRYAAGLGRLLHGDTAAAARVLVPLGDRAAPAVIEGVALPSTDQLLESFAPAPGPATAASPGGSGEVTIGEAQAGAAAGTGAEQAGHGYRVARAVLIDAGGDRVALMHTLATGVVITPFDEAEFGVTPLRRAIGETSGIVVRLVPDTGLWSAEHELGPADVAVIVGRADIGAIRDCVGRIRERFRTASLQPGLVVAVMDTGPRGSRTEVAAPRSGEAGESALPMKAAVPPDEAGPAGRVADEVQRSLQVPAIIVGRGGAGASALRDPIRMQARWSAIAPAPSVASVDALHRFVSSLETNGVNFASVPGLKERLAGTSLDRALADPAVVAAADAAGALRLLHGTGTLLVPPGVFDRVCRALAGPLRSAVPLAYMQSDRLTETVVAGRLRELSLTDPVTVVNAVMAELRARQQLLSLRVGADAVLTVAPAFFAPGPDPVVPESAVPIISFEMDTRPPSFVQLVLVQLEYGGFRLRAVGANGAELRAADGQVYWLHVRHHLEGEVDEALCRLDGWTDDLTFDERARFAPFWRTLDRAVRRALPEGAALRVIEHDAVPPSVSFEERPNLEPRPPASAEEREVEQAQAEQQTTESSRAGASQEGSATGTVAASVVIVGDDVTVCERLMSRFTGRGPASKDGRRVLSPPMEGDGAARALLSFAIAPTASLWALDIEHAAAVVIAIGEKTDPAQVGWIQSTVRALTAQRQQGPLQAFPLSPEADREEVLAHLDLRAAHQVRAADIDALMQLVDMLWQDQVPVVLYSEWIRRQGSFRVEWNDAAARLAGVRVLSDSGVVISDPAWFESTVLMLFERVQDLGPEGLPAAPMQLLVDTGVPKESRLEPRLERAGLEATLAELVRVGIAFRVRTEEGEVVAFPSVTPRFHLSGSPPTHEEPVLEISFPHPDRNTFVLLVAWLAFSGQIRLRAWGERAARFEGMGGVLWLVADDELTSRVRGYVDRYRARESRELIRRVTAMIRENTSLNAYVTAQGHS